ncbi:DUF2156 domain-containing protein [Corynebacterium hindlerae]|uniref:DUF2156 domain-containing protein n=1 Tax=Corynebacterium hindlerae TaxID=699041 RepID=A0A7G5FC75_9CORY|nr:DUF2156 domain-containing protein [Corynebacterium hindlerae]QMV84216.1 DUF2156 domain-containing protein [Corynebacterium hindlerae]
MKLKNYPVTLGAVVVLWALRATYGFDTDWIRDSLGFGISTDSPWWTVFSSALTVATWSGAVLLTIALLLLGGAVERNLGSRRYFLGAVIAHLIGLALGSACVWTLDKIGLYWGDMLEHERILNPFVWLVGISMYASAQMGPLWRHRIRTLLLVLTTTLILYAGVMADFAFFGAAISGLLLGQWVSHRKLQLPKSSLRESRVLVAIMVLTVFAGPWLSGMNPDAAGPFSDVAFFVVPELSSDLVTFVCEDNVAPAACARILSHLSASGVGQALANTMPLFIAAVFALGLARGRRIAYHFSLLALAVTVLAIGGELFRLGFDDPVFLVYISLPWLLCGGFLVARRGLFSVKLSVNRRLGFFAAVAGWFVATAAVWLVVGRMVFKASFSQLLAALPLRYLPPVVAKFASFDVLPTTPTAWALTQWVGVVFWAGFLVLFIRLIGSAPDPVSESDRVRARELLQAGGGDHLSWMTLWPGNSYWFGDGGYVAYRLHNGIAVTVGEPVGPPELADAFESYIYSTGAQVAWYSVRPSFAETRDHWNRVAVAEESVIPVVDAPEFKGKKFQDIRTARNRATKEGIHAEWTTWSECSLTVRAQIAEISEEWVSDKALPEMGFTLGGLAELDDPAVRLMLALDEEGQVHGVTSWLPAPGGIVLDFMRRRTDGFRPVVEFLIASVVEQAYNDGLSWVSLSGAPLAATDPGALGQVLERVGSALEPLYGFRSLAAFKRKFDPVHETWLMLYRDPLALPAIGMAVSKCYVPEIGAEARKLAWHTLGKN